MSQTQKVKRLRFVTTVPPKSEVRLVHEDTEVSFVPMEAIGEDGQIQTDRTKRIGEVMNGYTYFGEGDVVMAKITPCFENGKGAIASQLVNGIGFGTTELHVLRPEKGLDSRFLFYVTKSHDFRKLGEGEMYGAGGQKRVPESFVRDFRAFVPSMEEQHAIADFLDRESKRLDDLILMQTRLDELLIESRKAIVASVVCHGIGPSRNLRASGIEWLGEIPTDWKLTPVKRLFRLIVDPAPEDHGMELLSLYTDIGVRPRKELEARGNRATTTDGYFRVRKGDFVFNKLLAWMGAIGLSEYDGVTSPAYDILRPIVPMVDRYYDYLFRCGICLTEFRRHSRGIMDMRLRLYFDKLGPLLMPQPSLEEQAKIVEHLDRETTKIDAIRLSVADCIEKLREYRSALISAAVTGQIDVRNYHPQEAAALCQ
jgi:type I restriction enzyme S subunit